MLFFAAAWLGLIQNAAANNTMKVNWRIAGTLVNGVEVMNPFIFETLPHALIHVQAKGAPGRAKIRILSRAVLSFELADNLFGDCLTSGGLLFLVEQTDFVATFRDLSMLLATLDIGAICLDPNTGESDAVIDMIITGGTGRFAGATGTLSAMVTTRPVGINPLEPTFIAETGMVM